MKKRALSLFMAIALVVCMFSAVTLTAHAASITVTISEATYYDTGALKSMTAQFGWHTASAQSRLVLMQNRLQDGDFTNLGNYGSSFSNFDAVLTHDGANGTFGIKAYSDETAVNRDVQNTCTIQFTDGTIPLDTDATYYLYLWTQWNDNCYPDHLIAAIRVQGGVVQYAEATGENAYDESDFNFVVAAETYDVTVTPGANMTKTAESGAEAQTDLDVPMETVVYTANTGYWFPETYAVESVNNIRVTRLSDTQISVSGMPLADTAITLTAASKKILPLEEVVFPYAYDVQRNPAYPKAGDLVNMSGLDYPLVGKAEFGTTNEGSWKLTKLGTYSIIKDTIRDSQDLSFLVGIIADNYDGMTEQNVVIHELKDGDKHIAFGVAIAYDEDAEMALFIGDTWSGGGAYLLSSSALSGRIQCTADLDVTDWVAPPAYSITVVDHENGTTTLSAAKAIEGDTVTVFTSAAEGSSLTRIACTDGTNDILLTDEGDGTYTFTMPGKDVTVTTVYTPNTYTVTYVADGKTVATVEVVHGGNATAPAVPAKTDYDGKWDHDGKNITADTTITAVYTKKAANPATGDDTQLLLLSALMLLSVVGFTAMTVYRRKDTGR